MVTIDEAFGKFRLELVLELRPTYSLASSHDGFLLNMRALFRVKPPKGAPPPELEKVALRVGDSMFDLIMIGNLTKKYLNGPATPLARSFGIRYSTSLQV